MNFIKSLYIENCICCYCDEIFKFEDFDFDSILLDKKSYEVILIYDILYRSLIGSKLLHIRFDRIDLFFRVYEEVEI